MNGSDLQTLRELIGPWSRLALGAGLVGACASFLSSKGRLRPYVSVLDGWMAAGMCMLGAVIFLWVMPASWGYSGPVPSEIRHLRDYDKDLATLIALAFAAVLALEAFRHERRVTCPPPNLARAVHARIAVLCHFRGHGRHTTELRV